MRTQAEREALTVFAGEHGWTGLPSGFEPLGSVCGELGLTTQQARGWLNRNKPAPMQKLVPLCGTSFPPMHTYLTDTRCVTAWFCWCRV